MLRGARGERTHAVLKMPSNGSADSSDIHLGHDFHERLVAFCHDGRGDCAVPAPRKNQHYFSLVALCVSVACFEPASGLIRPTAPGVARCKGKVSVFH
jgi:hypothetical protein